MARDLIPPPSPAGRPDLEGTQTLRFVDLPPEPVTEAPAPPKVEQKLNLPPSQYRNRAAPVGSGYQPSAVEDRAVGTARFSSSC